MHERKRQHLDAEAKVRRRAVYFPGRQQRVHVAVGEACDELQMPRILRVFNRGVETGSVNHDGGQRSFGKAAN